MRVLSDAAHDLSSEFPGLDPGKVRMKNAPPWLESIWLPDVSALTLGTSIYLRAEVAGWDTDRLRRLLTHELVHVAQFRSMGTLSFLRRYLTEYLGGLVRCRGHKDSYLGISLEQEARRFETRFGGVGRDR